MGCSQWAKAAGVAAVIGVAGPVVAQELAGHTHGAHPHREVPAAVGGSVHERTTDNGSGVGGCEWFGAEGLPITQWNRATGDWGGLRTRLEDVGLSINAENVLEYSEVFEGGVERQDSLRNLLTLDVELNLEAAAGLHGGTFFAQYLSVTAENGGSGDVGDIQGFSNIENDRSLDVIYELWYEQLLLDDRVRVKVGKVDANSEFAYVAPLQDFSAAGELTNSSAGFMPTILGFPTYPDPAMSVNVFVALTQTQNTELVLGYGLYDGAAQDGVRTGSKGPGTFFEGSRSSDLFHVLEAQFAWQQLGELPGGSLSLGGWHHTGQFGRFDGGAEDGTAGFYGTIQQQLTSPDDENGGRGLYVFGQLGVADEDVAEVAVHYGMGAVQVGLGDFRPSDRVGAYLSLADLSDATGAGFDDDELAVEGFYRVEITPWVYVQPGVQWISNPSGDDAIDGAVVGQVRVGVAF